MREWLVIENSWKNAVFLPDGSDEPLGYIPRDVVEGELGIRIKDDCCTWFTREDCERMRNHPEWRTTAPIMDELIDRLRQTANKLPPPAPEPPHLLYGLLHEAADAISRLQIRIAHLEQDLARLRNAVKILPPK